MKRSKHSLSHYKLLTCDMGKLVPIGLVEALPGDTFQHSTSALIRMSPQLAPVMHPVTVRIHHWFVPHRLVMPTWEQFITGGSDGLGEGSSIPTTQGTASVGGLYDYYGVPTGVALPNGSVSQLPMLGYIKIFNEYYRDEDLVSAAAAQDLNNAAVQSIAWEKDYFTSARPWSQKGPSVTLPLAGSATVKTSASTLVTGTQEALKMYKTDGTEYSAGHYIMSGTGGLIQEANSGALTAASSIYPRNLYADLTGVTAAEITDVRRAFALQRYQEARAQYGSRYTEYLRYLGIHPQDARLQRPEYLGGGKQTVAFSEVLRTGNVTADDATKPIGQLKGHGIAAMRSNRYRYFVQEHGYIHTFMSIRPRSMYMNGMDRTWWKRTREEFYQKELELIGQQEILKGEIFAGAVDATNKETFGYQDRYAEYRHQRSSVSGEFRTTLDYWHLARKFASLPTLNSSFVQCDPSKRVFAEQTAHSCWVMASHSIQARRMVGKNTIGRVI